MVLASFLISQSVLSNTASGDVGPSGKAGTIKSIDTAIIGAGLAGLTASFYLKNHNFKIYEGGDRPGGRVFTGPTGEWGGQNLEELGGAEHIKRLCHDLKLPLETMEEKPSLNMTAQGTTLDALIREEIKVVDHALLSELMEESAPALTLKVFLDRYFERHPISHELRHYLDVSIADLVGNTPEHVDYYYGQHLFQYIDQKLNPEEEDSYLYLHSGNSTLIHALINHEKLKGKIEYNHIVTEISSEGGKISLTFKNGQKVLADHVILTLPFSTLKHVRIQEGLIPQDQMRIIHALPYGTNSKILIPFEFHGPITTTSTINHKGTTWINPGYPTMTFYYGGKAGEELTSGNVGTYVQDALPALEKAYPGLTLKKEEAVVINWPREPFAQGSYSYKAPGQLILFSKIGQVVLGHKFVIFPYPVRPIGDKIIFAGEHTSLHFSASMEGAVDSGMIAAKALSLLKNGGSYQAIEHTGIEGEA